jgi:geranylgeranyl diphosphate synthase, type II
MQTLLTDIQQYISSLSFAEKLPHRLYAPMQYILGLKGKRIRPILTALAYHAVSGNAPQKAVGLGCALELFHNFTLIHDDIMDNAPTRRGQPTVHEKWDRDVAILSGDAMFAISMGLVVQDFPEKAADLTQIFVKAAVEVCEGQMEDMDLAIQEAATIEDYIEMIRKKTSVLLGACLKLGAVAGGADAELAQKFYLFGEYAGLGFQLQDDLMDAFPPENFGKQEGGDIIENKKTFLLLKALELASDMQKAELIALLDEKDAQLKVKKVIAIFDALNIKALTEAKSTEYFEKARLLGEELKKVSDFEYLEKYLGEIVGRKS